MLKSKQERGLTRCCLGSEGTIDTGGDLSLQVFTTKYDTEKTYANIKTLVSSCMSSHGACRISPVGFVPSRLLKVSPHSGPDHIRLVETRSDGVWTWACLSYVWGGHQRHKTTRSVLPEYLKEICIEMLPQTIKDAVSVCRELGIPYLWIDSFCIVQDDELDKTREIPQMSLIYRHALLTIAAACARNVEEGFLHNVRPLCYLQFAPTSIRFRDRRGRESKPFVLAEKYVTAIAHEPIEPINSRAWALQEQLLSPRWLSYSSHGLEWSCRSCLRHVNGQPDWASRPGDIAELPRSIHSKGVIPCIPGLEMMPWESIIQLYSPRQATLCSDKLVALSAVAQTYSENAKQDDTYLAGIWRNSMPRSLLWSVEARCRCPRPPEHTAPSWSWASVSGEVQCDSTRSKIDGDCKLIDARTKTVNSNVFGAVLGGKLIVDAKVRECRVRYEGRQANQSTISHNHAYFRVSGGPLIGFEADTMEFWTSLCNEDTDVTLMIVTHERLWGRKGLVLVRITDSESFIRVSYFKTSYYLDEIASLREYDEFFEGFTIKRVTIV